MNHADDETFARFVERFARIERQVPDPPRLEVAARVGLGRGVRSVSPAFGAILVVILLAAVATLAGVGSHPSPVATPTVVISSGLTPRMTPQQVADRVIGLIHMSEALAGRVLKPARILSMTATKSTGDAGIVWLVDAEGTFTNNRFPPGASPSTATTGYYVISDADGGVLDYGFPLAPTTSPVPSPSSNPIPQPTGDLSADGAVELVRQYEQALAAGDPTAAWNILAPGFRSVGLEGNEQAYAVARTSFLASVGGQFTVIMRSDDPHVVQGWALPALTRGADLTRGYLIEAHYPLLAKSYPTADPTCASDFFIVAPDGAGTWWIWWAGDTAALGNGSCEGHPEFSP